MDVLTFRINLGARLRDTRALLVGILIFHQDENERNQVGLSYASKKLPSFCGFFEKRLLTLDVRLPISAFLIPRYRRTLTSAGSAS
ncbi:MAG: hypothetical protein DMG49_26730 [Acidobacteria bacterium]|nr:MAG: hypothetical protein DMG49_26730 [Acidobacteriota bacterium]